MPGACAAPKPGAHLAHQIDLALDVGTLRPLQELAERLPREQLHHDEERPSSSPMSKIVMMLRMQRVSRRSRFAMEPRARLGIVLEVGHHHLDGHVALHDAVVRAVDDTHRALCRYVRQSGSGRCWPADRRRGAGCSGSTAISGVTGQDGGDVVSGAARQRRLDQVEARLRGAVPPALNTAHGRCRRARRAVRPSTAGSGRRRRDRARSYVTSACSRAPRTLVSTWRIDEIRRHRIRSCLLTARTVAAHVSSRVSCVESRRRQADTSGCRPRWRRPSRFRRTAPRRRWCPCRCTRRDRSAARKTRRLARWTAVRRRLPGEQKRRLNAVGPREFRVLLRSPDEADNGLHCKAWTRLHLRSGRPCRRRRRTGWRAWYR